MKCAVTALNRFALVRITAIIVSHDQMKVGTKLQLCMDKLAYLSVIFSFWQVLRPKWWWPELRRSCGQTLSSSTRMWFWLRLRLPSPLKAWWSYVFVLTELLPADMVARVVKASRVFHEKDICRAVTFDRKPCQPTSKRIQFSQGYSHSRSAAKCSEPSSSVGHLLRRKHQWL